MVVHTDRAYQLFVGVDIAATTFTAAWQGLETPPSRPLTFAQTPPGFAALQQHLCTTEVSPAQTLIVMEATGSYWIALATFLHAAGFAVAIVNPTQTHKYAQSLSRRGKSDPIDAQALTQFARERRPQLWTPPPRVYHELRQRLMARDALLEMRKQAQNQRHALLQWPLQVDSVVEQFSAVIDDLNKRIAQLDAEISTVLDDSEWALSAALLRTIPGIGLLSTAWLLVATLNFTIAPSVEALTHYVGLAPMPHESGSSIYRRPMIGHYGHARLRSILYLASLSARRRNPVLKTAYERLRAAGKRPKVAQCAIARKLLHLAWAIVKKQQPFDLAYRTVSAAREPKREEFGVLTGN